MHSWAGAWACAGAEPLGWSEEEEELETRALPAGLADQAPSTSWPVTGPGTSPTPTQSSAQRLPKARGCPSQGQGDAVRELRTRSRAELFPMLPQRAVTHLTAAPAERVVRGLHSPPAGLTPLQPAHPQNCAGSSQHP